MEAILFAHVKWFADFDLSDPPIAWSELFSPTLLVLAAAGMLVVAVLPLVERFVEYAGWYRRVDEWFAQRVDQALLVLRVATGATLLLSWQADSMLAPELRVQAWVGWFQFLLALLLLFRRTVPLAGFGVILLWLLAALEYGVMHMLDYAHYLGIGWYLMVAQSNSIPVRESRIPALYLTVGFSLCWLAFEKLVYPQWTQYILAQNPQLALGFDPDFFRMGAAFVEFTLGYLFIICLFERPTAALVTLVFFVTTLAFGKLEVIGHTSIHGALVVFLLEGPGRFYRPPADFHTRLPMRSLFALVNYGILLAVGLLAYQFMAWQMHSGAAASAGAS